MNTMFLLMAEYETATVPLSQVCEKFFGMKAATAERKASENKLPIPTFRTAESQKAPRMVHISDLAEFIDRQREESKAIHQSLRHDVRLG
ncbi:MULTISPECIES: pyocin activator PrtN family protein [Pantoea]|uniref:pyocin activator PrtN family protein n=1 Tax=Pantoea TaxID=53335 RepID=UPI0005341358|nr:MULTISPECIES: pyocin activator PrtN family protein [Pantoea]MDU1575386.1 pyocin activator PrtN family protein [Pantoea sp.]MDU6388643.1 pyocin activator PrtN family protein [Pantoea sp.]MDU7840615.1 pyocin activator PrtN family protein [Pantoea sp.]PNK64478.1 pyocin activator protein PrtN [Pantoea sp. FDAARGOS_194]